MLNWGISYIRGKYVIDPSTFINYTNTRTTSKENQQGIWFYNYHNNHIVEGKKYQDVTLEDDLKTELAGILNFAFRGLIRLIEQNYNFTEPKACVKALEHYKNEHNVVKAFIHEAINVTGEKSDQIRSSTLFQKFDEFCRNNHYFRQAKQITKKKFFQQFDQAINDMNNLISKRKHSDSYYYVGMKYKK